MKHCLLCVLAVLTIFPPCSFAGARRFTYTYEATTASPGGFELENWVTWRTRTPNDHSFDRVDFRHEIEFGITDHLQMGLYLADWFYQNGRSVEVDGFIYSDSAVELIYNLSNPVTAPLGVAVYQEIQAGDRRFELESKLIAQKNFGRWVVAYNATLEAEWEGRDLEERNGEFQESLGASYELNPRFLTGAEVVHEIAFPEWKTAERSFFFAGPNVSVRAGKWWATVTALAQVTRAGDEPDFQVRTIFGYTF